MKAMVVSPVGGRVPPTRGVLQHSLSINGTRRDLEAEEVAAYLTKLRSLVPDMPRKRKLSKLEVIQRVIEYICDLQTTLEETNIHQDPSAVATPGMKTTSSSFASSASSSPGTAATVGGNSGNTNNNNNNTTTTTITVRDGPLQPLLNAAATAATSISLSTSGATGGAIAQR